MLAFLVILKVRININQNIKSQFEHAFKLKEIDREYYLDSSIGGGRGMVFRDFPGRMEFYHFKKSYFKIPIEMESLNPMGSEWFLIHINLSKTKQEKKVDNGVIDFQKHLPVGMLLYGPGLAITTPIPPHIEMELASIHFNRAFLDIYFDQWKDIIDPSKKFLYEDLDSELERVLQKALSSIHNKIECHAHVLVFMNLFLQKLSKHSKTNVNKNLHAADVQNLFKACAYLRNPLAKSAPSIKELATMSNMGSTKFKSLFKQVFGHAPIQYRNKIRMEWAREELANLRKTPTEVSIELGYAHPSNFTAAYKKFFDELPSKQGR